MKCPKCGAENADYLFYCGSCGAGLRDAPADRADVSLNDAPSQGSVDQAANHKAMLKKTMRRIALAFAALDIMWIFLAAVHLTDGEWDHQDRFYTFLFVTYLIIPVYIYWASTNDEILRFMRHAGWVGDVMVETTGVSLYATVSMPVIVAAAWIITLLWMADDAAILASLAITTGVFGLIMALITIRRPVVALERGGICVGYPSMNRVFLPFDRITSITLRKRMLTVSLNKRRPLAGKTVKLLLVGDIEGMRSELDRIAPSGTPAIAASSSQEEYAAPVMPEPSYVGMGDHDLTIAGALLIVAGLFAFSNVFALYFIFEDIFVRAAPLFCCGTLEVLFGAAAIIGGIQTMRGTKYKLAVLASIAAILSLGGLFMSPALGVAAIIMARRSREHFRD